MAIIRIKPPYKHIVQKPSFCGPCCVQMILFRQGMWVDQEKMASELDAGISRERKNIYMLKYKIVKDKKSVRLGVSLKDMGKRLNTLFRKHKLKLRSEIFHASQITNPKEFIADNMRSGNDMIIDFWLRQKSPEKGVGHYVLISEIDTKNNKITVCDPDYDSKAFWKIDIDEMMRLMDKSWDGNERGMVVIKRKP